ncbi:RagB/SusD family nutrient uptake outer membrane protein [Bacteroides thetaiotaomicron]|uniref:RagB/SusD family nutrient uptake outer membrane protein n=1 Tax=Bacteroides thetaiotaomicron TaxID=818 RepID=UPI0021662086|nr:RagB/SusD family nutrient uptake outer membrane protein [Bacteroides thetaiotaomicron]MCS2908841.1 RagB/SusD family nutrient uptake outer membrane protein [Bacteroides thetaiotaomicron]
MKNIFKIGTLALCLVVGLSSCNDFFDAIPGEQYDLEDTFTNRSKTEQFLNNVYNYVPDETLERSARNTMSGIWTTGSLECKLSWDGNNGSEWASGATYAGSSWINFWYIEYYKGISRASTFIMNVDRCLEASAAQRKQWKAQARALRAFYYFMIFRSYGPFVILGEEPIPLDISTAELLKERNTVDECVAFMAKEFDDAANELPDRYDGSNLGRIDRVHVKLSKRKCCCMRQVRYSIVIPIMPPSLIRKVASNSFRKINRRKKRNGRLHVMLTKNSLMNTVTLSLYIRRRQPMERLISMNLIEK